MGEKGLRLFIVGLFLIAFLGFASAENGNLTAENINTTINNKFHTRFSSSFNYFI